MFILPSHLDVVSRFKLPLQQTVSQVRLALPSCCFLEGQDKFRLFVAPSRSS